MKKLVSLFLVGLILSIATSAVVFNNLDNTEEFITADSYVRTYPSWSQSVNFGTQIVGYVEKNNNRIKQRVYQRIDLRDIRSLPGFTGLVTKAVLNQTVEESGDTSNIGIYLVNDDIWSTSWSEIKINWINQPCSKLICNLKVVPSSTKILINGNLIWSVDLTTIVNDALTQGKQRMTLMYKYTNEQVGIGKLTIYSRESDKYDGVGKPTTLEIIV